MLQTRLREQCSLPSRASHSVNTNEPGDYGAELLQSSQKRPGICQETEMLQNSVLYVQHVCSTRAIFC